MTQPSYVEEDFGADPFAFDELPPLNPLEDALALLMTSFNTLAECVANVDPSASEERLQTPGGLPGYTISQIVQHLKALQDCAQDQQNTLIPHAVLTMVDQGKNPNLYIKNLVERTATDNQFAHGMISALSDYRMDLRASLAMEFPDAFGDLALAAPQSELQTFKTEST